MLIYVNFMLISKKILFLSLFLAVLGLHCIGGYSLVAVHGLLIAVASLVAENGL